MVVVSNGLRGPMLGIEDESVIDFDGGDLPDQAEHVRGVVLKIMGDQVDVASRPTGIQCSR